MSLTITYTNESSEVKSQNSQGNISLILGYNGRPYDLHVINDNNLRIRIGNQEGYINDINIDTNTLDDDEKYRGAFTIPLSNSVIQQLPPGVYYLEVWINVSDQNNQTQQMIFPSDDTLPFTLTPNIVNDSNSLPMITFDRVRQAWEDFKNFIMGHQAQIEDDLATFDGVTDSFVDKVNDGISGYQGFVNQAGSQLNSLANSGKDNIAAGVNSANSNVATINSQVNSAKTQISTAANGVYSVVDSDVNSAESAINNTTASNKSETTSTVNSAENIINNAANGVVNGVNITVDSAMTRIDNAADGIRGQVEGIVSSGDNRINNTAFGIESVTSSAVNNANYISTSLVTLTNSAVSNVNYTVNSADNNMSNFANDINDRTSSADHHIDIDVSDAESNVASTVSSADSNMSNFASDINDRTSSADNHIDSDVTSADAHIDNDVASGDGHIDTTVSSADSHVSSNVLSGEDRISNDVTTGENSITTTTNSAVDRINQDTSIVNSDATGVTNMAQTYSNNMNSQANSAYSNITTSGNSVDNDINYSAQSAYSGINTSASSAYINIDGYNGSASTAISNNTSSGISAVNSAYGIASSAIQYAVDHSDKLIESDITNGVKSSVSSAFNDQAISVQAQVTQTSNDVANINSNVNLLSNSASNTAINVMNQANANMEVNRSNLQAQLNNGLATNAMPSPNIDDLNTLMTPGYYQFNGVNNIKNLPSGYGVNPGWFIVKVMQFGAGLIQIFYSYITNDIFMRSENTGTTDWNTDWKEISGQYRMDDLQNQINSHPNWNDENWTRNNLVPNLANSAKAEAMDHADQAATSAINQANINMDVNRSHLQNEIDNTSFFRGYLGSEIDFHSDNWETGVYRFQGATFHHAPDELNNGWGNIQVTWWDDGTHTFTVTDLTHHCVYIGDVGGGSDVQWRKIANQDEIDNLQNQVNNHPNWDDENWTRNTLAPSLANSAAAHADLVATRAINQANVNMDVNRRELQDQITQNNTKALANIPYGNIEAPTDDLNKLLTVGYYQFNGVNNIKNMPQGNHVNSGWFMVHVLSISAGYMQIFYSFCNNDMFIRGSNDYSSGYNNWEPWQELTGRDQMDSLQAQITNNSGLINDNNERLNIDEGRLLYHGEINESYDFANGDLPRGFYWFRGCNFSNSPCNIGDWGWIVSNYFDGGTSSIVIHDLTTQNIFFRTRSGNGNSAWKQIATTDDVNNIVNQANNAATNALNQANVNMDINRSNLQDQINHVQNEADKNTFSSWYAPTNCTNDLNTLITPGYYDFQGVNNADGSNSIANMPNFPTVNSGWFDIHVMTNSAGIYQIFYSFMNNEIYMRGSNSGGSQWTSWNEIGGDHIRTAANEDDARNQSNNNPNTLFVYSD